MDKLQLHLWYDKEAAEAARLYTRLIPDSRVSDSYIIPNTLSGDTEVIYFNLDGLEVQAISGGPYFKMTPAISLMVLCDSAEEVDRLWGALIEGGEALMPLDAYPFSPRYGWLKGRYGLNWQLMLSEGPIQQRVIPCLLFSGAATGQAEAALREYAALLAGDVLELNHYPEGLDHAPGARVSFALAEIAGKLLAFMDDGAEGNHAFNEALSLVVNCEDQAEIDRLWAALSHSPEHEQCGWLKDRFGLSWQIIPARMDALMRNADGSMNPGATRAMLQMKKLDIEALKAART